MLSGYKRGVWLSLATDALYLACWEVLIYYESVPRMNYSFSTLSIPIVAALIGWITNYIAVKMIFRPRKPIHFLGLRIQGLLPKRQYEIAESIGETVARDLLSHEDVRNAVGKLSLVDDFAALIDRQVDSFIGKFPMLAMFLQGDVLSQIKLGFRGEISNALPEVLEKIMDGVEENLDFKEIVSQRIKNFDISKLEQIVYRISSKELKAIEILGGVLGFLVGLFQLLLLQIGL